MFIFYGTKSKSKVLTTLNPSEQCMNCLNTVNHAVVRDRTYFTLFFIPLFPIRTRYTVVCPSCSFARKITGKQAREYRKQN